MILLIRFTSLFDYNTMIHTCLQLYIKLLEPWSGDNIHDYIKLHMSCFFRSSVKILGVSKYTTLTDQPQHYYRGKRSAPARPASVTSVLRSAVLPHGMNAFHAHRPQNEASVAAAFFRVQGGTRITNTVWWRLFLYLYGTTEPNPKKIDNPWLRTHGFR